MTKRKGIKIIIGISAIILLSQLLVLAACQPTSTTSNPAATQSQQNVKPIELRFAYFGGGPPDSVGIFYDSWGKAVEAKTAGKVKVTYYWSQSLVNVADSLEAIKTGVADIVTFPQPYFAKDFPISDAINLPFLIPSCTGVGKWLAEMQKENLLAECDPYKVVFFEPTGAVYLFLKDKKADSLAAMSGLKIRAPGGALTDTFTALGASPVFLPLGDIYMSLERGVIDGVAANAPVYTSVKLDELCQYTLSDPIAGGLMITLMSKDKWNEIPADLQKLIDEVSQKTHDDAQQFREEQDIITLKKAGEDGRVLYSLSDAEMANWKKTVAPVIDKWISDMNAAGLPGTKAVEIANEIMAKQ